ncbi:ABC transporter ATP-binding protein [Paracoccus panacisoli]|uniref:ABC transporter n=2 Tax=Paracoccus TaxID=265 RepID=A0A099G8T9_9RHOB|nr:ATP-binding cassette domain-containing protein [Paracoccus sanguinis]KGJ18062.1 ABC transporter [Paracoccus sanguinis]KGJ19076.1 ABC transporter [Paracoccus sanguinis]SDX52995.1 phospholipid/cholesterol/gamma-HCH transport system ATP-binding protein [Paracoccus sanguinis]
MTAPPVIEVRGLAKSYGATPVLDGLDLAVPRGESLVVIGGSGTGKSVLLRTILGLETPDAGAVLLNGAASTAAVRAAFMRDFGMLFQNAALFDSLPVWRNVAFRLIRTMPAAAARARAVERLARVGLGPETADRMPAELSGGMRKRVGLARAIAADPRVIFFDEPTTGLDPQRAAAINALIRGIVTETGATAVTITHDMTSVRTIADRVAFLAGGRIAWAGGVAEMDAAPDPRLRDFVEGRPRD